VQKLSSCFSDSFSLSPRLNASLSSTLRARERADAGIDLGLRGARNSKDLVAENTTRARGRESRQIVGIIATRARLTFEMSLDDVAAVRYPAVRGYRYACYARKRAFIRRELNQSR
jgi:hypothetical protein